MKRKKLIQNKVLQNHHQDIQKQVWLKALEEKGIGRPSTYVINVEFTAKIESEFDEIAEGKEEWKKMLREFYGPFEKELEKVEKELEHVELVEEVSDVPCEKCGRMMVYKYGRYGKFLYFYIEPGAGNGAQTRDLCLGKAALYQLSYSRIF